MIAIQTVNKKRKTTKKSKVSKKLREDKITDNEGQATEDETVTEIKNPEYVPPEFSSQEGFLSEEETAVPIQSQSGEAKCVISSFLRSPNCPFPESAFGLRMRSIRRRSPSQCLRETGLVLLSPLHT